LWDAAQLRVEALLDASNDLTRARAIFAAELRRGSVGRACRAFPWQRFVQIIDVRKLPDQIRCTYSARKIVSGLVLLILRNREARASWD
jgi:hypothetical protein